MPEIAEVERARTILEQILKDQTIIDVESVITLLNHLADPSSMTQLSSKTPRQTILQQPSEIKSRRCKTMGKVFLVKKIPFAVPDMKAPNGLTSTSGVS